MRKSSSNKRSCQNFFLSRTVFKTAMSLLTDNCLFDYSLTKSCFYPKPRIKPGEGFPIPVYPSTPKNMDQNIINFLCFIQCCSRFSLLT